MKRQQKRLYWHDNAHRYVYNGNNLDWDYMPMQWNCMDCGHDSEYCENHVHKYSFTNGAIYHDTNGNFIKLVGNVPMDVLTTDVLFEILQYADLTSDQRKRAWQTLKEKTDTYKYVIAYHTASNCSSFNIYAIDYSINEMALAGYDNDLPKWYKITHKGNNAYVNGVSLGKCMKVS